MLVHAIRENFGESAIMGWRQYITDMKEPSRVGVFKYWLFHDPNWDVRTLDFDRRTTIPRRPPAPGLTSAPSVFDPCPSVAQLFLDLALGAAPRLSVVRTVAT